MRNRNSLLITIIIICFFPIINCQALAFCNYSKQYKAWLKLTPEEQVKTIRPQICEKSADGYGQETTKAPANYSSTLDLFNSLAATAPAFDLRSIGGVSAVRDQGSNPNCWAYATMAAVESNLLVNGSSSYDFSERHMDYSTRKFFTDGAINEDGYDRNYNAGGNFLYSTSYLMRSGGPIAETEMPYSDYYDEIAISEIQNKNILIDINEITFLGDDYCSPDITSEIKENIIANGALFANIYIDFDESYYYEPGNALYYNGESGVPNHSIAIVGWDDNFSGFNPSNMPSQNGAWLVKNSYGSRWGDDGGYFYVSYADEFICNLVGGIVATDAEVEDNLYYHDPLGYNSYAYDELELQNYIYGANIFNTTAAEEELVEVTFAVPMALDYEIYVNDSARANPDDTDKDYLNSTNFTPVKSGSVDHEGYYTVKLDTPITLTESEFAIIIKFSYPDLATYFLPLSATNSSTFEYNVDPGNSYLSENRTDWLDAYIIDEGNPTFNSSISIKAATNTTSYKFNLTTTTYIENNYFVTNINSGTTYDNFLLSLNETENDKIDIYDIESNLVSSGNMATGMIMAVTSGGITHNYTLVVKGDINGDGNIGSNDALLLRRHVVGITSLGAAYQMAGDVDSNNSLSSLDALKIRRYVVGLGSL